MKINGVHIDDTFAEAFPMKATRIVITGMTLKWAYRAANSLIGFASSVIACGCEADIECELDPEETPDGRPGIAVIVFAMSTKQLADQVLKRVGQSVMTTATSACFSGLRCEPSIKLGKALRFFGDGYQISKKLNGVRYWRIPVMHGEFVCEEKTGVANAIGGGNFLVLAEDYAFVVITGRQLEHWHTGSMTRRATVLDALEPEPVISIHPEDLNQIGALPGDMSRIDSRRGSIEGRARSDTGMQRNSVFMAF